MLKTGIHAFDQVFRVVWELAGRENGWQPFECNGVGQLGVK